MNNPGMSEQAWKKLHSLMARLMQKYSGQLSDTEKTKKIG